MRFADSHTVRSGFQGVVTQLPTAGAIIHSGESLYQVGDEPAYLFRGSVPAWRAFESGMSNGEDITQLQTALGEMGHMQAEPDGNFGWRTIQAVRSWQKAMGLEKQWIQNRNSSAYARFVFDHYIVFFSRLKQFIVVCSHCRFICRHHMLAVI